MISSGLPLFIYCIGRVLIASGTKTKRQQQAVDGSVRATMIGENRQLGTDEPVEFEK